MCHEDKPEEAFAFRSLATGQRQSHCRACHAAYRRAHYLKNRAAYIAREVARSRAHRLQNKPLLLAYFATHPCVDCGETDPVLLEFDHRDPAAKAAEVTIMALTKSWARVLAEIEKCEVRCVVCHRRRTARRFGWAKLTLVERAEAARDVALECAPVASDGIRECTTCHRTLPLTEFAIKDRRTGRRSTKCRSCASEYGRAHYRANRQAYLARARRRDRRGERERLRLLVLRYLLEHPCVDCGERDVVLLEFDHRVPATKVAAIGWMIGHASRSEVLAEIDKCDVRCVRCHRIKTAQDFGWSRLGEEATIYAFAGVA